QFKTIKPVSAKIATKISIIGDTPYIDAQMFGDKSAQFLNIDAAPICSPCSLIFANAANCHYEPPIRHKLWHRQPQASRTHFAMFTVRYWRSCRRRCADLSELSRVHSGIIQRSWCRKFDSLLL